MVHRPCSHQSLGSTLTGSVAGCRRFAAKDDMKARPFKELALMVERGARVRRECGPPVGVSWNLGVPAEADRVIRDDDRPRFHWASCARETSLASLGRAGTRVSRSILARARGLGMVATILSGQSRRRQRRFAHPNSNLSGTACENAEERLRQRDLLARALEARPIS